MRPPKLNDRYGLLLGLALLPTAAAIALLVFPPALPLAWFIALVAGLGALAATMVGGALISGYTTNTAQVFMPQIDNELLTKIADPNEEIKLEENHYATELLKTAATDYSRFGKTVFSQEEEDLEPFQNINGDHFKEIQKIHKEIYNDSFKAKHPKVSAETVSLFLLTYHQNLGQGTLVEFMAGYQGSFSPNQATLLLNLSNNKRTSAMTPEGDGSLTMTLKSKPIEGNDYFFNVTLNCLAGRKPSITAKVEYKLPIALPKMLFTFSGEKACSVSNTTAAIAQGNQPEQFVQTNDGQTISLTEYATRNPRWFSGYQPRDLGADNATTPTETSIEAARAPSLSAGSDNTAAGRTRSDSQASEGGSTSSAASSASIGSGSVELTQPPLPGSPNKAQASIRPQPPVVSQETAGPPPAPGSNGAG